MIPPVQLRTIAATVGVDPSVVNRDYCQGWLLFGLAQTRLVDGLVFKGGTALRKCYFKNYRFSADLDFTCLVGAIAPDEIQAEIRHACTVAAGKSGIALAPAAWEQTRDANNEDAYEAKVSFRYPPAHPEPLPRIRLDLTYYERVLLAPMRRELLHAYSDATDLGAAVPVYAIEEIVAEKLRSLLQQATRHPRARDYYDLWQLLVRRDIRLDEAALLDAFRAKCNYKQVPFDSPAEFFLPYLLEECRDDWTKSVGRQVHLERRFDPVIAELRPAVERLFGQGS